MNVTSCMVGVGCDVPWGGGDRMVDVDMMDDVLDTGTGSVVVGLGLGLVQCDGNDVPVDDSL